MFRSQKLLGTRTNHKSFSTMFNVLRFWFLCMNDMLNIYVMMSQFIEIYIKKKRELDITDLGRKLYDPFYSNCYLYLI